MDFLFLPTAIRERMAGELDDSMDTMIILRCDNDMRGGFGEGYIIAGSESFLIFRRTSGESEYAMFTGRYDRPGDTAELHEDKYRPHLSVRTDGENFRISFSRSDREHVNRLLARWRPTNPDTAGNALPPITIMVASMIFAACEDGEVSPSEDAIIRRVCGNDATVLQPAFEFYNHHSFDDLMPAISKLSRQQALCILANMAEMSMVDGMVCDGEQRLLKQFCRAAGIALNELDRIFGVLMLKNELSVMNTTGE